MQVQRRRRVVLAQHFEARHTFRRAARWYRAAGQPFEAGRMLLQRAATADDYDMYARAAAFFYEVVKKSSSISSVWAAALEQRMVALERAGDLASSTGLKQEHYCSRIRCFDQKRKALGLGGHEDIAVRLYKKTARQLKEYAEAARWYEAAVMHFKAASCWEKAKELGAAAAAFEKSAAFDDAGRYWARIAEWAKAAACYAKASSFGQAATCSWEAGDWAAAAAAFERVEDFRNARHCWTQAATELAPGAPKKKLELLRKAAQCSEAVGECQTAAEYYERAEAFCDGVRVLLRCAPQVALAAAAHYGRRGPASHAAALYGALGHPLRQGVVLFGLGHCAEGAEAYLCGLTPSDDGVDVRRAACPRRSLRGDRGLRACGRLVPGRRRSLGDGGGAGGQGRGRHRPQGPRAARDGFERVHRSGTWPPGWAGAPGPRLPHSTGPSTSRPAICSGSAPLEWPPRAQLTGKHLASVLDAVLEPSRHLLLSDFEAALGPGGSLRRAEKCVQALGYALGAERMRDCLGHEEDDPFCGMFAACVWRWTAAKSRWRWTPWSTCTPTQLSHCSLKS